MRLEKRLRFDPASPLFWRKSGAFVIGYPDCAASQAIEVTNYTKQVATWLSLVDGTRSEAELMQSGMVLGIPRTALQKLVVSLVAAGHIYNFETLPSEVSVRSRLHALRFQATSIRMSLTELIAQRESFPIEISGAGSLPLLTFRLLEKHGFPVGWRPNSTNRIAPDDLPENLPSKLVGKRWTELATLEVEPKLQISFSDTYVPETALPRVPRLPVIWHARRVAIGPVLNLESGHSISCLHETRLAADEEWSFVLSQLLHNRRPLPRLDDPWLTLAANQIVLLAGNFANSEIPQELSHSSFEINPPYPIWQFNRLPTNSCPCVGAAA